MLHDPDQDLVSKAKTGDQKAYSILVEKYYEMVIAITYGILNRRSEAQDAAQEVFIKVWNQIKNFEGKSKFKSWLYRIATNQALDLIRQRKNTEPIETATTIQSKTLQPDEETVRNETKALVRKALEHLSPEHRAILVLREWQGLSYEEIAETLNLEPGTVMSRLFYARKSLGEILSQKMEI